jgi:Polyketide cyclase / dehydrase and lipid transport
MATVSMKATFHASADKVWETLKDFNGLPKFIAAIVKSDTKGAGIGAVRTLTLATGGPPIVERLEKMDDKARTLSYSIIESPLPLEKYFATMEIQPLGQTQCQLSWSSTFVPKGATEEAAKKVVEGVYTAGFEGLKKLYGG